MSDEYIQQVADEIAAKILAALDSPGDDRQLITLEEAMTQLRISRRSMQELVKRHRAFPVLVVGDGAKRVRQADIDAYLATRVEGASS
jgi:predicted DNA-binding transcriptional regulator AlpA